VSPALNLLRPLQRSIFSAYFPFSETQPPPRSGFFFMLAAQLTTHLQGTLRLDTSTPESVVRLELYLPQTQENPKLLTATQTHKVLPATASHLRFPAPIDTQSQTPIRPLQQAKILVISPNPNPLEHVQETLSGLNLRLRSETSVEQALQSLLQKPVDIFILSQLNPQTLTQAAHLLKKRQRQIRPLHASKFLALLPEPIPEPDTLPFAVLPFPPPKHEFINTLLRCWKECHKPIKPTTTPSEITSQFDALLKRYIRNLHQRIQKLHNALEHKNFEDIKMLGHKLKGSGASYGLDEITEIGRQIEVSAAHSPPQTQRLQALIETLQSTLLEIKNRYTED
ncbi:MAG: response regulator, partial [Myxococcota bacterium]